MKYKFSYYIEGVSSMESYEEVMDIANKYEELDGYLDDFLEDMRAKIRVSYDAETRSASFRVYYYPNSEWVMDRSKGWGFDIPFNVLLNTDVPHVGNCFINMSNAYFDILNWKIVQKNE